MFKKILFGLLLTCSGLQAQQIETPYKTKKIVAKNIVKATKQPSKYTVTYEYAYDKNLVQYDVSFDKAGGSNQIRDLSVAVFGESIK